MLMHKPPHCLTFTFPLSAACFNFKNLFLLYIILHLTIGDALFFVSKNIFLVRYEFEILPSEIQILMDY